MNRWQQYLLQRIILHVSLSICEIPSDELIAVIAPGNTLLGVPMTVRVGFAVPRLLIQHINWDYRMRLLLPRIIRSQWDFCRDGTNRCNRPHVEFHQPSAILIPKAEFSKILENCANYIL